MELSKAAKIFKALSCEQRLKLINFLSEEEEIDTCCDGVEKAFTNACEILKISRSTISHHFKELETAGLITCIRNGQSIACRVNQDLLNELKAML